MGAPSNTWSRILNKIGPKLSSHVFKNWFEPTKFITEDDTSLTVQVPNAWFVEWLSSNYQTLIADALRECERPGLRIDFRIAEQPRVAQPNPAPALSLVSDAGAPHGNRPGAALNPRYSFETFVVSSCNQLAHAAAMAVVSQPSRAYNPLYIYGGVGLGKTHLMQAIGLRLGSQAGLRMCYISSEHFMNELINSIRFEKTLEFKGRYRNVDLLLIDDIQFLAGKERTQEEFFHTFNALYDAQKQIVITSDVPPRQIPTLEERLRSRFEWGLIADIEPPDLETKVAILKKKAEAEGQPLPHDVALFVAKRCTSNIRELEGALVRVIASASVQRRPISLELAEDCLRDLSSVATPTITADRIQKVVAGQFNLKVSELKQRSNSQQYALPRQVAMYLCKQFTDASLPDIGRRFGGKHHSTVIHSIQKIERKRQEDRDFDRLVERLALSLK